MVVSRVSPIKDEIHWRKFFSSIWFCRAKCALQNCISETFDRMTFNKSCDWFSSESITLQSIWASVYEPLFFNTNWKPHQFLPENAHSLPLLYAKVWGSKSKCAVLKIALHWPQTTCFDIQPEPYLDQSFEKTMLYNKSDLRILLGDKIYLEQTILGAPRGCLLTSRHQYVCKSLRWTIHSV